MPTGTVKWFNPGKGFGFIVPDDGGSDVFVHVTAVEQAGLDGLQENQKVEYELVDLRMKSEIRICNVDIQNEHGKLMRR